MNKFMRKERKEKMTYRKKIASLCLAFALVITLLASVPGLSLSAYAETDMVEEAQKSVVRVFIPNVGRGSGFAVGPEGEDVEYIVTNNHVVEEDVNNVYVTVTDANNGIRTKVIYRDPFNDVAILKLSQKLTERQPIALLSSKELHKSQDVYCIGFPGLSDDYSGNGNLNSRTEDMTITKGTISNPQYNCGGRMTIMSDVTINKGNSGGPMVDEYGQAVGISSWGIKRDEEDNEMSLAVSIDYVIEALEDHDISYIAGSADGANKGETPDDGTNTYGLAYNLGRYGAIVLIVVGIVALIVKLTKKPQTVQAAAAPQTPQMPGYSPQPAPTERKMKIICKRGPMSGQKFSSHSVVRIGRNTATCQLVYPSGTPGISKEHCELRLTSSGIIVRDLNSSYGTFLSSGEKLAPGASKSIGSGDTIMLGSDKVVLSVMEVF